MICDSEHSDIDGDRRSVVVVKKDPKRRETALPVGPAHTSCLATKTALSTRAVGPTRPVALMS